MSMSPDQLGLPFPSWNPEQWETIIKIACSEKPYILLEAPTGAGKSGIVVGAANLLDQDLMILTGTKQLQDQYHDSLDITDVRGRNNFPCVIEPVTADMAPCTTGDTCHVKTITRHFFLPPDPHECEPCDRAESSPKPLLDQVCPYYWQRYFAEFRADKVVLNYTYWLTLVNYTGSFKGRGLTVFDEAHTLEDELRRFATVQFSNRVADRLGLDLCWLPEDDVEGWQHWAYNARVKLASEYFKITKNTIGPAQDENEKRRRRSILAFVRAADQFQRLEKEAWVGEKNDRYGSIEFKPIWVAPLTYDLVYRHLQEGSGKVLFMSGTILDPELFSTQLGLNPDDVDFIQMPSTFDADRRPFIYDPMPKGSYRDPVFAKQVAEHVDEILDNHPTESGIIHTVSYALAQTIIQNSRHSGRMITHDKENKAWQLGQFKMQSKAGAGPIWISPSSEMGLDLPYDDCRWQIIAKLPFPNKGDKQIRQIMKELPDGRPAPKATRWYNWVTLCRLMQAYGRGMRAPDDSCVTYIIDPNWRWFRQAIGKLVPGWFRKAWKKAPVRVVRKQDEVDLDIDALFARLGVGGR